jgi:hypothetical protein
MSYDEKFETLIRDVDLEEDTLERFVLPKWLLVVLCYALPGQLLIPSAVSATHGLFMPFLFTFLIGSALLYYIRYVSVVRAFMNQEKPLAEAYRDVKAQEHAQKYHPRENAMDARIGANSNLTPDEATNWDSLVQMLNVAENTDEPKPAKKRWGRKKP